MAGLAGFEKADALKIRTILIATRRWLFCAGTALLTAAPCCAQVIHLGAIIRGDTARPEVALVFTGHEYAEGGEEILRVLEREGAPASFFFTGAFLEAYPGLAKRAFEAGHYVGPHSDAHLLYCPWEDRQQLLVTRDSFQNDLRRNYQKLAALGIPSGSAPFFLPPYEWYNDSIAHWTAQEGLQLINMTPGTLTHADYTVPEAHNYRSSAAIWESLSRPPHLNGFLLLSHIGVGPRRPDKFYALLPRLIRWLRAGGYRLARVDELLQNE